MKKSFIIMAASLLGIFIMLGILTLTGVIGQHEIADAIHNSDTIIGTGANITTNVQGVEKALQDIVAVLDKVADNQEAMTSAVVQLTSNLDPSNETLHKEIIALLESKGFHCCCCKCSGETAPETQVPVVTYCSHANTKYTIGDGVHYKKCTDCGKFLETVTCKYNSNGYCYTCCSYKKPVETTTPETQAPAACVHTNTKVEAGNGTHNNVCTKCGVIVSTVNCTYSNGTCVCGNVCSHTTKVVAGNGTHNNVCTKCGVTVSTVNCTYTNGKCVCGNATHVHDFDVVFGRCACGATEGTITYEGRTTIYVNGKTSNVILPDGGSSNVILPDNFGDYICPDPILPDGGSSNVILPDNFGDYICPDPILPDGGSNVILPDSGSNIIAPDPTN